MMQKKQTQESWGSYINTSAKLDAKTNKKLLENKDIL